MANNDNVYVKIKGTAGRDSHLIQPKLMKSGNYVFQIIVENPDFSLNDLSNPDVAKAVQDVQTRIKSSNQYPTPSIFLTLPQYNNGSDKPNIIHFWRADKKLEIQVNQNPAEGQPVEVDVDTYVTDNNNASNYNYRVVRIHNVIFPDDNVKWYTPDTMAIEGYKSLEDQGIKRTAPVAPNNAGVQPAPKSNPLSNGGANNNPFGNNANAGAPTTAAPNAGVAPTAPNAGTTPNTGAAPTQQAQTPYTQNANGQSTTNTNPFGAQNGQAPANPFANAQNGQANTGNLFGTQNGQAGTQNPGTANAGNSFANPQNSPQGQTGQTNGTQANPFGAQNGQAAGNQNGAQDPFANNNVNLSDDNLPF